MTNTTKEYREKIWDGEFETTDMFRKNYLKITIEDSETRTWTYDEEKIEVYVDTDGTLHLFDDRRWVTVVNLKALEVLKEGVDVAIKVHKAKNR